MLRPSHYNAPPSPIASKRPRQSDAQHALRLLKIVLFAFAIALSASACGSKQQNVKATKPGDTGYLVRSLKVDGLKQANKDKLRASLATRPLSLNPFGTNRTLNRYDLQNDVARMETFYQLNGFFDVKVLGQPEVTYFDDVLRAKVLFHVDEGEPSYVTETRILDARTGSLDPVTAAASGFGYLVSRIDRRLPLKRGEIFSYDEMIETATLLRRRLQELGYARAVVEARAYVSRSDHEVIVVYSIDPGAVSVFGDLTISGNDRVPDRVIRKSANLERGKDFRPSVLEAARTRLYGLDEFQVVDITTGLEENAPGRINKDGDKKLEQDEDPLSSKAGEMRLAEAFPPDLDPFDDDVHQKYRALSDGWDDLPPVEHLRAQPKLGWRADALSYALDNEGYDAAFAVSAAPYGDETVLAQGGFDFSKLQVQDPHIDVHIHVSESAAAAYRFGFGAEVDSGRWAAFARGNAIWRDVFGPLNTFEADLRVGYAWLPTPLIKTLRPQDVRNHGVIARSSLKYKRPQLLWNAWDLNAGVRIDKEVELAYDLLTFGGDIGIGRRWRSHFRLDLGYSFDYSRETSTLDRTLDKYKIAWLSALAAVDYRDDAMQPRKGVYAELLTEIGDPFAGDFTFVKLRPDLRGYIPMGGRFTLAMRGTVGFLFSIPSDDPVPISYRLYEGGSTSFRGVPYKRLSPHRYRLRSTDPSIPSTNVYDNPGDCAQALGGLQSGGVGDTFSCRPEPIGGFFSAVFSIEPRYEIGKDWLFGALFMDAGTVQSQAIPRFRLNEDDWHLAVGGGLRIATPLGPIRADIAYRFTNAQAYDRLSRVVFFIAIGEAF